MRTPLPVTALLALAPVTLAAPLAAQDVRVPFEELGRAFVERNCLGGAICPLADVLRQRFKLAQVGAFDVFLPNEGLADGHEAELLSEALLGLFQAQAVLVDWLAGDAATARAVEDDVRLVVKSAKKWKAKTLEAAADSEDADFFAAVGVEPDVQAALGRLRAVFDEPDARLGIQPRHPQRPRLLLCSRRRDFMELIGYMGLAEPATRERYWVDAVADWTYLWWGWTVLLALEYSPLSGFDPEFRSGKPMNELSKTGLVEHTNQQALKTLLYHWYGRAEPRHEEKGLAINIAIAVSGRANTLDGDGSITTSGASTAPYSLFVPGGNPNGGILPPISAAPMNAIVTSDWRKGDGADYFVAALRKGQKEGAKLASKDRDDPKARDPNAHFLLKSIEGGKHVVSAPFFGDAAATQQYPPAEYMNDYRELFRSYLTCFLYWLRTNGAGSPEDSRTRFGDLLRRMDEVNTERSFEDLVQEVYGMPISAADGSVDSLEWSFLAWLPKGRAAR